MSGLELRYSGLLERACRKTLDPFHLPQGSGKHLPACLLSQEALKMGSQFVQGKRCQYLFEEKRNSMANTLHPEVSESTEELLLVGKVIKREEKSQKRQNSQTQTYSQTESGYMRAKRYAISL